MIIKNVKVFTEDNKFKKGEIIIENGVFKDKATDFCEVIDGNGGYAIPGLIDIHFHGCMGEDFCNGTPQAIKKIARYEASVGVTSIAPATMTLPIELLEQILENAREYNKNGDVPEATLVGINMEGPFISAEKKGAQNGKYIIPCDVDIFHRFQRAAGGLVKIIGVAPEIDGAIEFIESVKGEISISLAHTNASYDVAKLAYEKGADHATHLYNAMPEYTHRSPGVVGAAYDSKHCMVELICDGIHIHPAVVRATFDMFTDDRIILISDSMEATGMKDGIYMLGGQKVKVTGNRANLVEGGAIAGSATNLMDCLRVLVKDMKIPLESAIKCATVNPAKSIGIYDKYGSITEGKIANLVLLNKDLSLQKVIING